jgi:predicted NBD/HSP70 family sugar kinase
MDRAPVNPSRLPIYVPEQIELYQGDHLITQDVCGFDPNRAATMLRDAPEVMAIDIGGDKIRKAIYTFENGYIERREEAVLQSKGGAGYLDFLQRLASEAEARNLRIGISSATKLDGSVITRTVNLPIFFEEMRAAYDSNYEHLFPGRVFVANDTVTGICGASTHIATTGQSSDETAFFICASGVGASVIKDGRAIHVEAAHVPLVDILNPLDQRTPCNVEGKAYVCVERVTAVRAGIESLYRQRTGTALEGVALGKLYECGDPLSVQLFETSALVLAHAIVGVLQRYGFTSSARTAVVLHGGSFEVARYRAELTRNLDAILAPPRPRVVFSRDISSNICLDGAAVLAIYHAR